MTKYEIEKSDTKEDAQTKIMSESTKVLELRKENTDLKQKMKLIETTRN
jgi:hypothetical protein